MSERSRYFTPNEVSLHNTPEDCWVSFLGKVYNLTPLVKDHKGNVQLKPILSNAGKDISHWFNPKTKDPRTYVDPVSGCPLPYAPNGRFVHIPPPTPQSNWASDVARPWWRNDNEYCIGLLSQKTRMLKIINTLTLQEHVIEVCSEETMNEILKRYLVHNAHAASYTWKYDCRVLDMNKTLEENGIVDEDETFYELGMDEREHLQAIHVYYNDDLTEA